MTRIGRTRARWRATSPGLRGALWMSLAAVGFSVLMVLVRHASAEMHPFQVAFFRNLFGLVFMLPWLIQVGFGALRTQRIGLYSIRAVVGLGAMLTWFWAIAMMPLGEAVALSFTTPLFATIGAALFLSEIVRRRRWTATLLGFAGVLIVLRPGAEAITLPAIMVLISAALIASAALLVKVLSRTEPTNAMVTYMVVFLTPMSLIPALFFWEWPSLAMWPFLVAMGGVATAAHVCMTRAFHLADASALMPFEYVKLPSAVLLGYIFFSETIDIFTWIGAAVIAGATVYIAHREAQARKGTEKPAGTRTEAGEAATRQGPPPRSWNP